MNKVIFSIIIDSVTGFHSVHIAVNFLYNTCSDCTNLGPFNVCCMKKFFTYYDCNWPFHFLMP